jgi:hypothetical protein
MPKVRKGPMPTSTNIAKYPVQMLDVIEQVCETRKPCTIAYPTTRAAKSERLRFYGLIRAIVVSKHSLAEAASKLTITLFGQDRKHPNVIQISYPTFNEDFYTAVAEQHRLEAGLEPAEPDKPNPLLPKPGDSIQ